ncbi:VOC family protein [Glycomyces paridis]|uniref:VOC family protein n=1 Tax=Glycomyces paridis TaxID=2126555 RepID=A0A4S8PJJ2_9ACTN|nr:VOC family protein [Glycomyces paridis]THV30858.1 VOC family protein [Glycomyces paridis]
MPAIAALTTVVLDAADPEALAAFYGKVTGWPVAYRDEDTVQLGGGALSLGFQRVAGYRGPGWPDDAKHCHLDFAVADVGQAVESLLAAGATRPEFQPGGGDWTVLADPEGHLLCLSAA